MPAAQPLVPHLSAEDIRRRYLASKGGVHHIRWHAIFLKSLGKPHKEIAELTGRGPRWVGTTIRRYNEDGPDGLIDKRAHNGNALMLSDADQDRLYGVMKSPPADGGLWTGFKVKAWLEENTDHDEVGLSTVYDYLHRLGLSWQQPRPQHTKADKNEQEVLKKGGSNVR